jgi:TPR repeat protein
MSKPGLAFYNKGDYDKSFRKYTLYLKNCKSKNSKVYYESHEMIDNILEKHTLTKDVLRWLYSYKIPEVQIVQSKVYYKGSGIERSYEKTIETLEKIDHHHAYYLLGEMYSNGSGVKQNDDRAKEYYQKGSKKDRYASYALGNIYRMEGDIKKAMRYYEMSSNQGYYLAHYHYAQMLEKSDKSIPEIVEYYKKSYKESMRLASVTPGQSRSADYLCQNGGDKFGNQMALERLKILYHENTFPLNSVIKFFERLPMDKDVYRRLNYLYLKKMEDTYYRTNIYMVYEAKAIELNRKREEDEDPEALYYLGKIYEKSDKDKSDMYYIRSAQLGYPDALHYLGETYHLTNEKEALRCFQKADESDHIGAKVWIGFMKQNREETIPIWTGILERLKSHRCHHNIKSEFNGYLKNDIKGRKEHITAKNNDSCRTLRCQFADNDHWIYYISKELAKIYEKRSDIKKSVSYWLISNSGTEIGELLQNNPYYLDKVITSVYLRDKLYLKEKDDIFTSQNDIKQYVEKKIGALNVVLIDRLKDVKYFLEHEDNTEKTVRTVLSKTSLFVNVLHDVIMKYI